MKKYIHFRQKDFNCLIEEDVYQINDKEILYQNLKLILEDYAQCSVEYRFDKVKEPTDIFEEKRIHEKKNGS